MRSIQRKAQSASSAATLIVLIAGFILLYILFLPAEEREALLGDGSYVYPEGSSSSTTVSTSPASAAAALVAETVLSESPGQIYYLQESSFEHSISPVNLYTLTEATVLFSQDSLYVKNGMFDELSRNLTFYLDDPDYTDNVLLSFNVEEGQGRIIVKLNGNLIYEGEITSGAITPLDLSAYSLSDVNILEFSVSEVGT